MKVFVSKYVDNAHLHKLYEMWFFTMAIYHLHVKNLSRRKGNILEAAAYRCGGKLRDRYGELHDYSRKQGIIYSEIILPIMASDEFHDREVLWNAVDAAEKRKNSRTAREVEIALPVELDRSNQLSLVREFVQSNFVKHGMCADFSLHDKGSGNPHVHILLTTRRVTPDGFSTKDRTWNDRQNLNIWRKQWADMCNRRFIQLGINQRIDHRTLAAQGIQREPTIHLGRKVIAMERCGKKMERGEKYREIIARNLELENQKENQRKKKQRHSHSRSH